MIYDVFISYRRKNGALMARLLRDRLEDRKIRVFLDLEELRSGDFNEKIYDNIRDSKNFILILSKNALDNCKNERDWVRKEIFKALELKKNIVLVLCEDFKWPRTWDPDIPPQIIELQRYNGVGSSHEYCSAFIDKVISFLVNVEPEASDHKQEPWTSTQDYFAQSMTDLSAVSSLDMAFHAGAMWHWEENFTDLLYDLINANVSIRVMINTAEAAEAMARHMRNTRRSYIPFSTCIQKWTAFQREHPEHIELRVSALPLLRRYYSFHMKDHTMDTVNVKHYTYANAYRDKNQQVIFSSESDHFHLFRNEFDYLWALAENPAGKS